MSKRILAICIVAASFGIAAAQENPAPSAAPKPLLEKAPQLGGATNISYYRVGAAEFSPTAHNVEWTRDGPNDRFFSLHPMPVYFYANPHLPGGALLRSIEFDNCDTNAAGLHMSFWLMDCSYLGNCDNTLSSHTSAENAGLGCSYVIDDLTSHQYVVDNNFRVLSISVFIQTNDDTNKFAGATIGYQLQVSPPPATASFNDVPTNHPYFQFVEALVASGVTAGCGNGNYCPESSITRGQMAVFLAKALGLSWSQ